MGNKQNLESILLDSRLITRVRFDKYNYKIVKCGKYLQVYYYKQAQIKETKKLNINRLKKISSDNEEKTIRNNNIIRTKLNCQRLAKANSNEWKSFVTLTYSENIQNMAQAKKDLSYFLKNIQKIKKDFKYIAIPEFQKRGAIHFHLLTNLSLEDKNIVVRQKDNKKYFDIKFWNKGFTSFEMLDSDIKKVVGYISKYMTKECDNRLFAVKRYTASQNLIKPKEEYIDLNDKQQRDYFLKIIERKNCIYSNTYIDYSGNEVIFSEFIEKE